MRFENSLDSIHSRIRQNTWLQVFTAFTRLLLGIAFIPPGIVKILHRPFTMLPDSNPVGHYFGALYQTGFYYEFLGWGQLIAAVLLLFPRTAHLGALLFLPIILNITVLTTSVGFKGTPYITNAMFLAALFLAAWEYDRWKPIVFGKNTVKANVLRYGSALIPVLVAAGGVLMAGIFYLTGIADLYRRPVMLFAVLPILGLVFGIFVAVHHRFMRVGPLEKSTDSL